MKKATLAFALAAVAVAVFMVVSRNAPDEGDAGPAAAAGRAGEKAHIPQAEGRKARAPEERPAGEAPEEADHPEDEPQAEPAEQSAADAFDALVDRWMEPSAKGVTMDDVDAFAAAFRAVPEDQRDDGIRRALNLIPDENALLLAGVLMDKSQGRETVETVFNDVLNRGEEVKMPILKQIFKDKTHPCWADAAWIFDATGETPQN